MKFSHTLLLLFSACCLLSIAQAATYDEGQAKTYAYASALSHCSPDSIKSWNCGVNCDKLSGYKYFFAQVFNVSPQESLSFAFIYNPTQKKFITTYRGTVGNVQMILEVLEGNSVPYALSNIPGAVADNYFYNRYVKYLRPIVIPQLQAAKKAFPDYQFIFTGHSLGAALTTLHAFDAVTQGIIPKEKVIMYNFGSPRVGNAILAQAIQSVIPVIFRVTHWADLVPHVPPCIADKNGVCKTSKSLGDPPLLWPAYHLTPEIFYDANCAKHKVCNGGEDPTCADQFPLVKTSMDWHSQYLNISIGCDSSRQKKSQSQSHKIAI